MSESDLLEHTEFLANVEYSLDGDEDFERMVDGDEDLSDEFDDEDAFFNDDFDKELDDRVDDAYENNSDYYANIDEDDELF